MTPRLALTGLSVVGAFALAGLGVVEGDAALAFAAGALAFPSVADSGTRRPSARPNDHT